MQDRFLARLDDCRVGDRVKLTLLREGKKIEVPAALQTGL